MRGVGNDYWEKETASACGPCPAHTWGHVHVHVVHRGQVSSSGGTTMATRGMPVSHIGGGRWVGYSGPLWVMGQGMVSEILREDPERGSSRLARWTLGKRACTRDMH